MDEIQCLPNQKVISQFIFLSPGADVFSMHDNGCEQESGHGDAALLMLAKEACRLSSPDKKRSSSCLLQPRNVKKTKGAPTIFISVWEYNLLMVQFSRYIPFPL
ncbi:hypothetical protein PVAP13_5NG446440 [Panicum virgatum]|uniref:Uncharacterized protein n=1 Tax=Panicum virgatum TaxID=38727 RepID=A0A8T0S280_PANVG|nr:hypothetical protein PVAP13_5NG446440 [Panicum virgatum]